VEVGGIEVDVGVAGLLQGPVQEGLHLHVDLLADAAHLGLGDAALDAQGGHQGIDLAGGDAADVGLHHHGIEGLIHPAAGLEDRGQEAAGCAVWGSAGRCRPPGWPGCGAGSRCGSRVAPRCARGGRRRSRRRPPARSAAAGHARTSSGISSPAVLPSSSGARRVRHHGSWAWFVWLRWFSNQGHGPAHPLQRQPLSQPSEVRGPPRLRRGGTGYTVET
jgi:hypothetical protein